MHLKDVAWIAAEALLWVCLICMLYIVALVVYDVGYRDGYASAHGWHVTHDDGEPQP